MKSPEDMLSILKPSVEGSCCQLLIEYGDGQLEIELSPEGAEALAMCLLAMVENAEVKKEGMN